MNQHDQMLRDALQALLDVQNGPPLFKTKDEWESAMKAGYEALATQPAPLVRLTDEEIQEVWEPLHDAVCLDHKVFAHAIMDAMIAKNGGS